VWSLPQLLLGNRRVGRLKESARAFLKEIPSPLQALLDVQAHNRARHLRGAVFVQIEYLTRLVAERGTELERWVVQERVLAPRTLNLGISLIWECREVELNEFGFEFFRAIQSAPLKTLLSVSEHVAESNTPVDGKNATLLPFWCDILVEYTKSDLRFSSDRLPAIKGIIQEIEGRTGWNNVLGMWEPFLLHELMWTHFPREQYQPRIPGIPAWSWVSVQGMATYLHTRGSFQCADGFDLGLSNSIILVSFGSGMLKISVSDKSSGETY
jgi:hypothetical protein